MSTAQLSTTVLSRPHRAICFAVFLISGLTLFLLQFLAFNSKNRLFQSCVFVALPVVFTLTTVLLYRSRNLNAYWQAYFSYTTTAIAITLMWLLDDLLVNWLGLDSKKPAGMAVEKVTDAVILISTVILLSKLFRVSLGSIYLQRGKLKLGLIFGILGFAVMATFGVLQARSLGISFERIREWTPWLLNLLSGEWVYGRAYRQRTFPKEVPTISRYLSLQLGHRHCLLYRPCWGDLFVRLAYISGGVVRVCITRGLFDAEDRCFVGFGTFPRGSRYSDHDRNICWREDVRATAELD